MACGLSHRYISTVLFTHEIRTLESYNVVWCGSVVMSKGRFILVESVVIGIV